MAEKPQNESPSKKRDAGRPSKYKPEFDQQAEKLCHLGATDDEIAEFFDIHIRTLYRWKYDYPSFCHALKIGKEDADNRVERSLYQKATGYTYVEEQVVKIKVGQHEEKVEIVEVERQVPTDTTAAIFWLKNRRSAEWRDRREIEATVEVKKPVSLSELEEQILSDDTEPGG